MAQRLTGRAHVSLLPYTDEVPRGHGAVYPAGQPPASAQSAGAPLASASQHRVKSPTHAVHGQVVQPAAMITPRQLPPMQASSTAQTFVQPPQLSGSVSGFVQPPPHIIVPPGHIPAPTQVLALQSGVAPLQGVPHAPQFAAFAVVSTHVPPQSIRPVRQTHEPALHISRSPQVWPHAPQFCGSFCVSVQPPPGHIIVPAAQLQTPDTQAPPPAQRMPHMPQLRGSIERSAQPAPHITCVPPQVHAPAVHVPVAPQEFPQRPQFIGSVIRFTQPVAPHVAPPPPGQLQTPEMHDWPVAHACPHAPQSVVDVVGSAQPVEHRI